MIKVNIYFQDLREDKQHEIREKLLRELKDNIDYEIEQAGTENEIEKADIANEVVDSYINTHNFAVSYEI